MDQYYMGKSCIDWLNHCYLEVLNLHVFLKVAAISLCRLKSLTRKDHFYSQV